MNMYKIVLKGKGECFESAVGDFVVNKEGCGWCGNENSFAGFNVQIFGL